MNIKVIAQNSVTNEAEEATASELPTNSRNECSVDMKCLQLKPLRMAAVQENSELVRGRGPQRPTNGLIESLTIQLARIWAILAPGGV